MNSAELKIREILNDHKDVLSAAKAVSKAWKKNLFDTKEQFVIAQFFLNAGLKRQFLAEVEKLSKYERPLPWAQISELLAELRLAPSADEQDAIVLGLREQNAMDEILRSKKSDRLSPQIAKARKQSLLKEAERIEEEKRSAREKIEFLRSQRMMDEELKALNQFHDTYPEEGGQSKDQQSFDERWARHVVGENIDHNLTRTVFDEKGAPLPADQLDVRSLMLGRSREMIRKNPEKNYDLAMTLAFMDFFDEALEVLRLSERSREAEWFELELLLKSRKFLEALELSQNLEIKFVEDPESSFAAIYARARALWGLGQKTQAIEYMKSIVKVKPQYKNSHSLLNYWLGLA